MSYGGSLTPPTRVEKAAVYGPGASQRKSGSALAIDQLPRGGELRFPAVEVSAQLAAAQLVEHLPHSGRLGEPERRQVGAGDVEPDGAQALEVLPQCRHFRDGEREQRSVGRVGIGQGDDLGGISSPVA